MSKPFTKQFTKAISLILFFVTNAVFALDADKKEDFILDGDNFKNLPTVENGQTKAKFWGNVIAEQGSLKIQAQEAIIFNGKNGVSKVVLTGNQVKMQQIIDEQYGKINVKADKIVFLMIEDKLLMTGNVLIKSKIQGEMSGEKISMNLKTKEIKGKKSNNGRVRLTIKPNK